MSPLEEKTADVGESFDPDLLIRHALERGLVEEAGEAIDALIAATPDDPEGWFLAGVRGLLRGDWARSASFFEEALRRGADRRAARLGRAMACLGAERESEAWAILVDLFDDVPGDHEIVHWLLRAGAALGRWRELAALLERHLDRRPDDDAARFAYAGVSLRIGRYHVARAEYDRLRDRRADLAGLEDLARLLEPETLAASAA